MKNLSAVLFLFLLCNDAFAQNAKYFSRNSMYQDGENPRLVIKKEKLGEAIVMCDIVPNYPKQWNELIDYVSVEIIVSHEGICLTSKNTNDTLTTEQKNILSKGDFGSEIIILTNFKYKDPKNDGVGSNRKIKEMQFVVTVVPEAEAEFPGGDQQFANYLKESVIDKLGGTDSTLKIPGAEVLFTVNEHGEIADAKITKPSSNEKINKLVLDAIYKMPKWKPAQNAMGIKVKQEFKLNAPNRGC